MRRQEKRRKFHEALVTMLYPPQREDQKEPSAKSSPEEFDVDSIPGAVDFGENCSSTSDGGSEGEAESESRKMTRAQRKRLRKKKLKEDASRREKIIGPLLPSAISIESEPVGVRRNADEKLDTGIHKPGEPAACIDQSKLKQRRVNKRVARERLKSSNTECL